MKKDSLKLILVLTAAVLVLAPLCAGADVFMKEKIQTEGMKIMGQAQPPQEKVSTTWISQDKMRKDEGEVSTIARMVDGRMKIYHLNHPEKTYTELSFDSGDLRDMTASMAEGMKLKVTPTGETRTIGTWKCRKYLQEMDMGMMPMHSEVWASEDITIPYQDFFDRMTLTMMAQQPGTQVSMQAVQEEMQKIKGVPVLTVTTTTIMKGMNMKTSRELLEIKEGKAPEGSFEIPPGYARQEMPKGLGETGMPGKRKPK